MTAAATTAVLPLETYEVDYIGPPNFANFYAPQGDRGSQTGGRYPRIFRGAQYTRNFMPQSVQYQQSASYHGPYQTYQPPQQPQYQPPQQPQYQLPQQPQYQHIQQQPPIHFHQYQ